MEPVRRLSRYHILTRSASPPGTHVLVFDGDCGFCRATVEFIRRLARTDIALVPFSQVDQGSLLTSLNRSEFLASAHYITPDGREYHGGESITRALRLVPGGLIVGMLHLWGLSWFRELGYALVASNRSLLSPLARLFSRHDPSSVQLCPTRNDPSGKP